ncbi:MAG: efflux RND transporter periplasmic adaptor subunit [Hyphomicrobiaceae bacterium]
MRKLLLIPPALLGVFILWWTVSGRQPPAQAPVSETARSVRVITLDRQNVAPSLSGFGSVKPENVWTGVAQVSGQVVYVNPDFRRGANLEKGTVLIRISPEDYRLAIAEAEAQIRSSEASLAELAVSETNTSELLSIEQESLDLKEKSVAAKRALLRRGNIAELSFDDELRDLLTQKKRVQDLKNALRLIPTQKSVQEEQIRVNRSKLETAKLNLKRTVITLPFRARIASVDVEVSQYVQVGTKIGVADGMATAQITAQYPLIHIRGFFRALRAEFKPEEQTWKSREDFARAIGLNALVHLRTGERDVMWRGRVARLSDALDEQTRTVGLITLVDEPYGNDRPADGPPLVKGMFVEVELRANALKNKIVVPSGGLHGEIVHLVGADDRLVVRTVEIGYRGDGFVVIKQGLDAGDRLIVSDVSPAKAGMLLKPVEDDALKKRLKFAAAMSEPTQ